MRFPALLLLALAPVAANANTQIDLSGGASSYAFTQMIRPEFGLGVTQTVGNHLFANARLRSAMANKDPNGGTATTLALSAGGKWHLNSHLYAGAFGEFQHLWYGPSLENTAIGGGIMAGVEDGPWFASMRVADLFGVSGNIGYHLQHPGTDYVFYGRAGYRISQNLSVYAYLTQQRYVDVGPYGSNSLTYQGAGAGVLFGF